MKVNRKLLPIKAHYFFFMAAMGPILPQLQVYGKELGISSVVMGSVTGVLPLIFLIAKPAFGMLVDVYRNYRKAIFMMLIVTMTLSYALMNFIPPEPNVEIHVDDLDNLVLDTCNATDIQNERQCNNQTTTVTCTSQCLMEPTDFLMNVLNATASQYRLCSFTNESLNINTSASCSIECKEDIEKDGECLYLSFTFWSFIILMSIGTIGFNVTNSISDAICFDVIGEEYDYGKQRVWGTIGFGVSALIAGYVVDLFSGNSISYTPAIIVMLICSVLDLAACIKLKLPIIESPENIFKDIKRLLNNRTVITFIIFAVFAGVVDSFIIYYLFWYLEDLAASTGTTNIKLLEGLIVAAETLGGEVIFFSISGKILERFGHVHCFSMCFVNYALRLGLISIVPSPWWVVPIEFLLQGPTYALTYTTIVAYANELAPPGASATMQGIAAGMDDGFANLVMVDCGCNFTWTSPVMSTLSSPDPRINPLGSPVTPLQESWIASLIHLGAAIGPLVFGKFADIIGRKKLLIIMLLLKIISYIALALAQHIYLFYLSRFLIGIGMGLSFSVMPMYTGEISENHNRGKLVSMIGVAITLGMLYPLTVGLLLPMKTFTLSCAVFVIIALVGFISFIPESPIFLVIKKKRAQAVKTLMKLRNTNADSAELEVAELIQMIEEEKARKSKLTDLLKTRSLRKGLTICLTICALQHFSGVLPIMGFLSPIFEASGSKIPADLSVVLVAVIQLFATVFASFTIDKWGRKPLLLSSTSGACVSLLSLGFYFYLKESGSHLTQTFFWLPVASLILFNIAFNVGLMSVPPALQSELFPSNVRSTVLSFVTFFGAFSGFLVTFISPILMFHLGSAKCFWLFAIFTAVGTTFIYLVVPETKGKSISEIQTILSKGGR